MEKFILKGIDPATDKTVYALSLKNGQRAVTTDAQEAYIYYNFNVARAAIEIFDCKKITDDGSANVYQWKVLEITNAIWFRGKYITDPKEIEEARKEIESLSDDFVSTTTISKN